MGKTRNKKIESSTKMDSPTKKTAKSTEANERQTFIRWWPQIVAVATTLGVIALGWFYLVVRNSDVLFMAQSKDLFVPDSTFLAVCMHRPGGFISWVSCWLTQFFYHPALGAAIMIACWLASIWLSKFVYRAHMIWMPVLAIPSVCLLVSTIDMGYWIYYTKHMGYWFHGSVGYFVSMVLVLVHEAMRKNSDRVIIVGLIALTYPFFGWYTLLALAYVSFLSLACAKEKGSWTGNAILILMPWLLIGVVPALCYNLYTSVRIQDMWTLGFPIFENGNVTTWRLSIPFMVLAAVPLVFPFLPRRTNNPHTFLGSALVAAIIGAGSWLWAEQSDFQNYNYHAEMRMYRAADEQDWDKVLDEMSDLPGNASRQMVLLKNIALLNKGEMGTQMFKYNNMGATPENGFDTLRVHMVQTAAPLIYYYHGKTNFAVRWCIENSVEYGYDYDQLKILARCALVNGESDMAKRYLDILHTTRYYRDWAEHLMPITKNPALIKNYKEFDSVRELYNHMGTVLDGDNGLCEMYLLNYFSNTNNKDSKLLQELTLNYALVQKDIQLFWPRFFLYAQLHKGEKMPVHYQEAAMLYGNLEPDNVNIATMPFDESVKESYRNFQDMAQSLMKAGMSNEEVREATKSLYGGTFYWFYFFCRDIHSY